MFRRTQACGFCKRIVVNVENHYCGTVIYCTQPPRASSVKSKRPFLHDTVVNEGLNNVRITDDLTRPKNKSFKMYYEKKNTPNRNKNTSQPNNTLFLFCGDGVFITIAAARPIPCAAADRTITFPSRRPIMHLPLQLCSKQTKDPVFNRNNRHALIMEDLLI